jgi:phosphonate transport system substrate-binding protein
MFLLLLSALFSQPEEPPAVRVGTYSYPRYDRRIALEPLAAMIERVSGRPTRIILLDTPDALAEAVCAGEVDVAMTNLGAFVKMEKCAGVTPIAVLDPPFSVLDRYRGVLLAQRADAVTLGTLKARARHLRYSEVLPGSTSGALVQAHALRALGVAPSRFRSVRQAGTHEAALEELLSGRADLAALAEEPWRKLQVEAPERAATLKLLWRSVPLPVGPVVCRAGSATPCGAIQAALLGPQGADAAGPLAKGWTETEGARGFRPYPPEEYQAFSPG